MKYINYNMDAINYLKAYGVEQKTGDLFYKRLPSGNYVMYWQSNNDIDVYLCRWLPSSHEDLDDSCIIDKILSFDDTNADKVTKFKQILKNER